MQLVKLLIDITQLLGQILEIILMIWPYIPLTT